MYAFRQSRRSSLFAVVFSLCFFLTSPANADQDTVTLLFTNDFESAFDPITAFWLDDIERIGGIAELATLIERIREREPNTFLFDSGDIFTGTLSKLTRGELPFELMITMGYDAMTIGNHEFEYGWQEFARQKNRVPFPVLGANLFYKGTTHPFAQPYTIIERGGIRIGVIGVLGQDAATALIPKNIAGVDVYPPGPIVTKLVQKLRPQVDLLVLLTHQGKTAPMQTDDSARLDIQRDIAEDLALAGVVAGIDVLFAGHADAGTRKPIVHPETGTLIMQTYGQGTHLGFLQIRLDQQARSITSFEGKLLTVDSDAYPPHPGVTKKLEHYRSRFPEIYQAIGTAQRRLSRQYNRESDLGNLFADVLRKYTGAVIGLMPSGALRKDLPKGVLRKVDLLDAFPFEDRVAVVQLSGALLREVIEQGLSLERGILQVSGVVVRYDPERPGGSRVLEILIGGNPIEDEAMYPVATVEILAKGGDLYRQFNRASEVRLLEVTFSDLLERFFVGGPIVQLPERGRLIPL